MPTLSPLASIQTPQNSDPDLVPADMATIVSGIEPRISLRFATVAARDAAVPSPILGMIACIDATAEVYMYASNGWRLVPLPGSPSQQAIPFAMAAGITTISLSAAVNASVLITLPVGRFTQPPVVQLTRTAAPALGAALIPVVFGTTAASFSAAMYEANGVARTVSVTAAWTAIQMTSLSAAG